MHLIALSYVEFHNISEIDTHKPLNSFELPSCLLCLLRIESNISHLKAKGSALVYFQDNVWSSLAEKCKVCKLLKKNTIHCGTCKSDENTWVCLICGFLGCNRYLEGHAEAHFDESSHLMAVEVTFHHVWHYLRDVFVHIICKTNNGKFIELHDVEDNSIDKQSLSRYDQIAEDYNANMVENFSIQRAFYENKLEGMLAVFEDRINGLKIESEKYKGMIVKLKKTLESEENEKRNKLKEMRQFLEDKKKKIEERSEFSEMLTKDIEDYQNIAKNRSDDSKELEEIVNKIKRKRKLIEEKKAELAKIMEEVEK